MWAVKVVVREGKPMRLNRDEQRLAAHLMKIKGIDGISQAYRLGISHDLVGKFWRMPSPIPLEDVDPEMIGNKIPPTHHISRSDVRMMTGS